MKSGLSVKELCVVSIMACIEAAVFNVFSNILYLEGITLTILLFSSVFKRRCGILAAVVYGLVNMIVNGVTPWSMMYLLIYPCYSLLGSCLNAAFKDHLIPWCILCAFLSFLTGQLLQLPFLLVSDKVTIFYLITGLKTSLIQGGLSAVLCFLTFRPLRDVLKRIERRLNV